MVAAVLLGAALQIEARTPRARATIAPQPAAARQRQPRKTPPPLPLPCGDVLSFAVLLDRQGFSPGQITGTATPNFSRALMALRSARNVAATGDPDCDTWQVLGADTADPVITSYPVSDEDVNATYTPQIPPKISEQGKLPALEYRSPLEKIAERFHASPALLQRLNPGLTLAAGRVINVPAVQPFDAVTKPAADPQAADVSIRVSREESALRVSRPDGTLVFFAPVTTGSQHDPLPPGRWTVTTVNWRPVFHYNPGPVLGRETGRFEEHYSRRSEQSGRRGVDRSRPGALRHSRYAGAWTCRQDCIAWMREADQLGCGAAGGAGQARHARGVPMTR